jgi:hypothetical protein
MDGFTASRETTSQPAMSALRNLAQHDESQRYARECSFELRYP